MILGLSDFITLRNGGTYVDKTDIIDELAPLLQSSTSIIMNRPRRFGKSLMVSMLEAFFSDELDSKMYFEGLKIAASNNYSLLNQFPVIKLSFKNASTAEPSSMIRAIKMMLSEVYDHFATRLLHICDDRERAYFQSIISINADDTEYSHCLDVLSSLIYRATNKKPIILIDEYDAPIEASYGSSSYHEVLTFLKALFIATFKDTPSYGFGFITGVFGIAKGTLGTGLNNIPVDSGPNSPLKKNYFGFTQEEVRQLCKANNISEEDCDRLESYYGGYRFLGESFYNPWSILNYLSTRSLFAFWGNSGSNKAFSKVVDVAFSYDAELITCLLDDGVETQLDFTASYEDIDSSPEHILLYLILAGYLTLNQISFNKYYVFLPNQECKAAFADEIVSRYHDKAGARKIMRLKKALYQGDGQELVSFFSDFLLSSLSYYDFSDEKNYQIMVGTIAALLFDECIVKHEVIAGTGRCDIMISPLKEHAFGAVIEIKFVNARTSIQRLQGRAQTALNQIKKHLYAKELFVRNANPIMAYGFAFFKNNIAVKEEKLR